MNAVSATPFIGHPLVALGDAGPITRADFWRRVNGLIAAAAAAPPARRYALVCEDTGWFAAGLIALLTSGRTVVVPQAPRPESLRDAGAQFDAVLTDTPDRFGEFKVLPVRDPGDAVPEDPSVPPDDACIEFYTSGSAGAPKCIVKRFGQLRREGEALERQWGEQLGEALVIGTVPHYHMYGVNLRILWPMIAGRPFVTATCLHPATVRVTAAGRRCIVVSSPAFLSRINNCDELPPAAQVAAIFSSGGPLPEAAAEKLGREWGQAPIEIYGSTETGGVAWRSRTDAAGSDLWEALKDVDIELRPEAAGDRLWVRSAFTDNGDWFATGDLARREDSGRFTLLGRTDDVIKFEDKRVSLAQMRARLLRHEWVADARLLLVTGRRTVIGAAVALNEAGRDALNRTGILAVRESLQNWLAESYERVLLPRKWRFPTDWPQDGMSKVGRDWLEDLFREQS